MTQPTPRLSSLFKLEYPQSVGVYNTYDEAQKVVDFLADARFPVENLCIVGTELRSVERVLGRRSWGTVIGQGVQSGVSTGLMIALLMWLFVPNENPLLLAAYALGIGIVVGIIMAALAYWMSQGKRDFTSVSQTIATKYEVLAEHKVVSRARELVSGMPGVRAAQFNPAAGPAQQVPQQNFAPAPVPYGQAPGQFGPYGQAPGQYGQGGPGQYPQAPGPYGQPAGPYGHPGQQQPYYPSGQPQSGPYGYGPEVTPTGLGYPEHDQPVPPASGPAPEEPGKSEPGRDGN